jgi:hypothetical protein
MQKTPGRLRQADPCVEERQWTRLEEPSHDQYTPEERDG